MKPLLFMIAFRPKRSKQIKWFGLVVKRHMHTHNFNHVSADWGITYISTDGLTSKMIQRRCLFNSKKELKEVALGLIGKFHLDSGYFRVSVDHTTLHTMKDSRSRNRIHCYYLETNMQKLNVSAWNNHSVHADSRFKRVSKIRERYPYIKILV